jgi:chromosome segregation ATPase
VTEPDAHFQLIEFEQVEAAPGTALLRVAARPSATTGVGTLTLVITNGEHLYRHEQLPALPGPADLIRAAFSVPLAHISNGATFVLELPGGEVVRLPAPARRRAPLGMPPSPVAGAGATPPVSGPAAEEPGPSRLVDAERRAEARRLALSEVERRLESERERRAAAESDISHLRAERDEARAERDAALADRDEALADRDQAEGRARAAAAAAGTLEAQVWAAADEATHAQTALEAQLADRTSELERMRAAAEVAQARAHASRREVASFDEKLAHAQAQVTVLEHTLDEREAERELAAAAMDDAIAAARAETAGVYERVTALEDELESQRDAIARSEAQQSYDVETARARLDVAHAEIEMARTDAEALRHHNAELESTLAEFDTALAARAAEIELLRGAVAAAGERSAAEASQAGDSPADHSDDVDLDARLAQARAEASGPLLAEVELLRAQVAEYGNRLDAARSSRDTALARADTAEAALATRSSELEQLDEKVREQVKDVQRSREELVAVAEQTEAQRERERQRADAAEARNHELVEVLRAETEKRIRTEEALIAASAQHALTTESLALEAGRREA